MVNLNPFGLICSNLKTNAWELLPVEADELNRMSAEVYAKFFNSLSSAEQELVASYKQQAETATRQICEIKERGASSQEVVTLKETALQNLAAIRQMKQVHTLFTGFDHLCDAAFFRKNVYAKIPKAERSDVLAKALAVADELPCPFKRMNFLQVLAQVLPEEREQALPHLVSILTQCNSRQSKNVILSFVAGVPRERLGNYLIHVHAILALVPTQDWHLIHETLMRSAKKADTALFAACILPSQMPPDCTRVSEALEAIMEVRNMQELLLFTSGLTRLCHGRNSEGHIADIVRLVAQFPDAERADIVRRTLALVDGTNHDCVVFDTLYVLYRAGADRRERVYEILTQAYQGIERTDFRNMMARLRGVLPYIFPQVGVGFSDTIEALANLFMNSVYINAEQEKSYEFEIARKECTSAPFQVLSSLTDLFKQKVKTALKFTFRNEPAIGHGPGKEFICELFRGVCEKLAMSRCRSNGLYRPFNAELSIEKREVFNNLGQLFMFCLTASKEYLIGVELDLSVFRALVLLQQKHIDESFDSLVAHEEGFNELFDIYAQMHSEHAADKLSVKYMKKMGRCEEVLDAMRGALVPCIAIKQGMMVSLFSKNVLQEMTAEQMELKLQGLLQPAVVISKLKFDGSIPKCKIQWLLNWVSKCDNAKLEAFLQTTTAARSIGAAVISFKLSPDNVTHFQTCDNQVELALDEVTSEKLMHKLLDRQCGDTSFSTV